MTTLPFVRLVRVCFLSILMTLLSCPGLGQFSDPKLNEEYAAADKLSDEELVRQVATAQPPFMYNDRYGRPTNIRFTIALSTLCSRGLTVPVARELVRIGCSHSAREIFTAIGKPVFESTATAEEKQVNDELLRIVPPLFDGPNSSLDAMEVLARMAYNRDALWDAGGSNPWPEAPYRNEEITRALLKALENADWRVRKEAANALAAVAANDPNLALEVVEALQKRIAAEPNKPDTEDDSYVQELILSTRSIIQDLKSYVEKTGGTFREPARWEAILAWQSPPTPFEEFEQSLPVDADASSEAAPPAPEMAMGRKDNYGILIVGGVLAAVIVLVAVMVLRRRAKRAMSGQDTKV